jgi:hypothetical protein
MSRLENDPEYQRKKAAFHAEVQERASVLRAAEQPIVADLRAAGVSVDSVWDLVNTSEPYPNALPVLIEHLERGGYPDRVVESLGRALAVKPAVAFWRRLKALYMLHTTIRVRKTALRLPLPPARPRSNSMI